MSASVIVIVLLALLIVLLVSVWVPVVVTTVLSIANVTVLSDTVELKPVPPANVNVSPVLKVSVVELSSWIVKELAAASLKDKLPEPSVKFSLKNFRHWTLLFLWLFVIRFLL